MNEIATIIAWIMLKNSIKTENIEIKNQNGIFAINVKNSLDWIDDESFLDEVLEEEFADDIIDEDNADEFIQDLIGQDMSDISDDFDVTDPSNSNTPPNISNIENDAKKPEEVKVLEKPKNIEDILNLPKQSIVKNDVAIDIDLDNFMLDNFLLPSETIKTNTEKGSVFENIADNIKKATESLKEKISAGDSSKKTTPQNDEVKKEEQGFLDKVIGYFKGKEGDNKGNKKIESIIKNREIIEAIKNKGDKLSVQDIELIEDILVKEGIYVEDDNFDTIIISEDAKDLHKEFTNIKPVRRNFENFRNKDIPNELMAEQNLDNRHIPRIIGRKEKEFYLFKAVYNNDLRMINSMIRDIADLNNIFDQNGHSLLTLATENRNKDALLYLVNKGANINLENRLLVRPLDIAIKIGDIQMVKTMIALKCGLNYYNKDGDTPLISAMKTGNLYMVYLFLNNGANPKMPNLIKKTPMNIAKDIGNKDFVDLINKAEKNE